MRSYRLSIAKALEPYRSEIEFACGFVDACYGLARDDGAERILHYGADAPSGATTVPAVLFPAGVYADKEGLHPRREKLPDLVKSSAGGLLPPAGQIKQRQTFSYDAVGLIFFCLSRIEERDHMARDRYQRFPISAALIAPENGRLYPWADRAARDLATVISGDDNLAPRTRYEVKFTHDVDMLKGYHRPFEPLRNAVGDVVKRAGPRTAVARLRNAYLAGEPWISFRGLMELSERHGLTSRFYFMGPSDNLMDSPYAISMKPLLRAVANEVCDRGHIAGFHPGFYTAKDAHEWNRQRDGLESVIGVPVREGRQHVLRYDAVVTPRIWSDAGMALDCTLAYPEVVGFRSGTCRPHHAYDLVARCALPLQQISTAVMEFGLFGSKYRNLTREAALADSRWAVDICREYGGTFVFLFHTGQMQRDLWSWLVPTIEYAAS